LKQVFVLTDGEVSNADGVIQLVKKNCHKGRLFALGLGASASRHLVSFIHIFLFLGQIMTMESDQD